jgi:hypothetical protein
MVPRFLDFRILIPKKDYDIGILLLPSVRNLNFETGLPRTNVIPIVKFLVIYIQGVGG